MKAQDNNKDLNFGLIMRKLRKEKKIIIPPLKDWQVEILVESLDWYTNHILSKFPKLKLDKIRERIAEAIANKKIRLRDIQEMRSIKEQEVFR